MKKNGAAAASSRLPTSNSPMDVHLLQQLVKLMADNGLSTVELTDGERRITLKRGAESVVMPAAAPQAYMPALPAVAAPAPAAPAGDDQSRFLKIKSPMVGTFYASPAKGAKPYVTVGSPVDEATDVCIIEAMKNFNVHKAECRGTIAKILVQDGEPVEFGQALFLVNPG